MSFWRHARSIGPMWVLASPKAEPECRLPLVGTEVWQRARSRSRPCSSSAMSRTGYSLAGCAPAEPASASPDASILL